MSGIAAGAALAVKLTSLAFVIGIALVVAAGFGVRAALRFGAGLAGSTLVLQGPWSVYLWVRHGSPVFPFFNNIFRSGSAVRENWRDTRWGARTPLDVLALPFRLAAGTSEYGENEATEVRIVVAVVLCGVAALSVVVRQRRLDLRRILRTGAGSLASALAVGGLIWAVQFGYYRYGLVLEIAGSLLIVWSLSRWSRRAVVAAGVMCLPLLVVFHTKSLDRDENLFTRVPPVAPDSHVLLEAEKPVSYLALSFPDSASFASLSDFGEVFRVDGPLADDLREFVRRGLAEGNLYVVTAATGEPDLSVLSPISLELERSTCREFQERSRVLRLCRAVDGAGA